MPEAEAGAARLSEEVLADARRKAERRVRAAEREAAAIVAKAREEAERDARHLTEEAQRRADRQRQLILATVSQEIRRRRLLKQGGLLEALIQAGFDRAARMPPEETRGPLLRLSVEAIRQMEAPAFRLEVNEAARRLLGDDPSGFLAEVAGGLCGTGCLQPVSGPGTGCDQPVPHTPTLTLAEEPVPIAGGVIVRAADGSQMVDNSLEARRRRLAPQLRQVLAAMVFAEEDEESAAAGGAATVV